MYCIQIIQEKFFSLHEIEKSIEEGKKAIKIKYLSKVIEDSILFLKEDWMPFKPYLRTFNNKSLIIVHGPTCSMSELGKRRSKRRSITLVKRLP